MLNADCDDVKMDFVDVVTEVNSKIPSLFVEVLEVEVKNHPVRGIRELPRNRDCWGVGCEAVDLLVEFIEN